MEITKTYLMLMVSDMDRAIAFYHEGVGLDLRFRSPEWSELAWGDAVVALHGGAQDIDLHETGLGFEVRDLEGALGELVEAGGRIVRPPEDREGEPIRLAEVADPDGNVFSVVQPIW